MPVSEWQSLDIGGYILMKKTKIVAALMALASFVLSAGAFVTWR